MSPRSLLKKKRAAIASPRTCVRLNQVIIGGQSQRALPPDLVAKQVALHALALRPAHPGWRYLVVQASKQIFIEAEVTPVR